MKQLGQPFHKMVVFMIKFIMNTNKKGDIGLAKVILDITKKGFFLFLPFSDTTHVDLVIADDNMKLYRNGILPVS